MWVARDKNGELFLWKYKPERGDELWNVEGMFTFEPWFMIDSNLFPNLSWEDEPIEIEIIPKSAKETLLEYEAIYDHVNYAGKSMLCDTGEDFREKVSKYIVENFWNLV